MIDDPARALVPPFEPALLPPADRTPPESTVERVDLPPLVCWVVEPPPLVLPPPLL